MTCILKKWLKNNESNIKKRIIKAWILVIKKSANLYLRQFADSEERTGSRGQAPRICFANPRLYVPRAPPRRTARDGLSVRSLLKKKRKIKNRETKIASLPWWRRTGSRGQAPCICFANPRLYVPRAPPRRTARDGLSVRSLLKKKRKIKSRETKIASLLWWRRTGSNR